MMKTKLLKIYNTLYETYGPQHWWPGDTPWEICVGAVLTQNTNWSNVEKAIANLKISKNLFPEKIIAMPDAELEDALRPSGYFRIKTKRLKNVTRWWLDNVISDKLSNARGRSFWRKSILSVNGVGPETADSILLYSFNMPTFVIDAYTRRIMARHCGTPENIDYHELQNVFMENLPLNYKLFNEYHALLVRMAKEDCKKSGCSEDCPLCKLKNIKAR